LHTAVVSVQTEKISEQSEDCLDQFIKIVDKKDEIENYKKELTLEKTGNSLDWWRIRQDKYPALAELAKIFLGILLLSVYLAMLGS